MRYREDRQREFHPDEAKHEHAGVRRCVYAAGARDPEGVHHAIDGVSAVPSSQHVRHAAEAVQGGVRCDMEPAVLGVLLGGLSNEQTPATCVGEGAAHAHCVRAGLRGVGEEEENDA